MIFHAFQDYHFLELQDDNGDIIGYTAMQLLEHLMDQYVQPEDIADQITELHQILEQIYDPNDEPQVYYKAVQDARNTLESLNETVEESTLIRHGLNQFQEHLDLKMDIKAWKKLARGDKTWKNFKSHFTRAINDNKSDTGSLKAIAIANAVKEQVDQSKENQRVLAQATVEANDKIKSLEKQQAQLYAALMAKQPQQVLPLQDTTATTIKALTDKINRLEGGSGGGGGGGRRGYRKAGSKSYPGTMIVVFEQQDDGIMTITVGHVDMI
jgi:predicted nuclease with TOPRIM domain